MRQFLQKALGKGLIMFALFLLPVLMQAQSIWTNPITGTNPNSVNPYTTGDDADANITVSGIGRGSGIAGNAGNDRYNATGWSTGAISLTDYFTFTLTPNSTYTISFVSLEFNLQRSSTGPANFAVRSSADNYAANITTFAVSTANTAVAKTVTLSGTAFQDVSTAITFRVYGYTAGNASGTCSINDFTFNGTVAGTAVAPAITSSLTGTSVYNTSATYTITASGSPTSYAATSLPTGATFSGSTITFANTVAAGTYNISISATNASGTDTKTLVYTRTKANQSITFSPDPIPAKTVGDAAFNLTSTASSGLAVTYASSNTTVATVSGSTVTILAAGTTSITASQAGNTNYNAATNVSRTLTVNPAPAITAAAISPQGPFCSGASQALTVTFATEGTFTGSFSVQYSNEAGVFPGDNVTNIIGSGNSPVTATLPAGLVSGNYNLRVLNGNVYSNNVAFVLAANTWTGAADNNWNNSANWSCGSVPTDNTPAVIANTANQPLITGNTVAHAASVEVLSPAALTVETGNTLTVQNAVNVATGGLLTVANGANLVQVNNTANTGSITVNRNSLPLFRNDYILWSAPVAGQNLQSFSQQTLSNRFYTYNPATNQYNAIAPDSNPFSLAKGYLIRMPDTGSAAYVAGTETLAFNGAFNGTPNNGNITLTLATGYNAIGNPYPSTLNFYAFINANIQNNDIEGQVWLWRKTNNSNNTSYATMTKAAYTRNDATGGGVPNNQITPATYELNVGQGFIVKSLTGTVAFNNSMRGTTFNNPAFRNASDTAENATLWLNLTSTTGNFSQIAVAYRSDATLGYDNGLDGRLLADSATRLYSFADNAEMTIQARPSFTVEDVVPVGLVIANAGTYTISIDNFNGLFQSQDVFLKDNLDNTIHDLKAGAYTFSADAGTFNSRFEVLYINTLLGVDYPVAAANAIVVYKQQDNTLVINAGKLDMAEVSLYDISGRLLYNKKNVAGSQLAIDRLPIAQQVVIVQVTTSQNLKFSKKIIY